MIQDSSSDDLFDLAFGHHQAGQLAEAESLYRRILATNPEDGDALQLLGLVRSQLGNKEEALELLSRAASINPNAPDCQYHLGVLLSELNRQPEAIAAYRQAVNLQPDFAEAHYQLGLSLRAMGDWLFAINSFSKAVELRPTDISAQMMLGITQNATGQSRHAAATFRRIIALQPDNVDALNNLGNALLVEGELGDSAAAFRKAIALRPDFFLAHNNLANVLKEMGNIGEAMESYKTAMQLHPFHGFHSNLLYTMHLLPNLNPETIYREHLQWNQQHANPFATEILPHDNDRSPVRRLRIGYVSCDFREHPVAFFFENLLSHHDPERIESFCYADVPVPDAMTDRIRKSAHQWRNIAGLSDTKVAEMIRQDKIDILVDLAGHTAGNRLLVFARKPAPIQVSYLGYPDTTGLSTMDYRLTDQYADPPGQTEAFHTEQLVRLPDCFLCYSPPASAPSVNNLPALSAGKITFGSFNNLAKISELSIQMWAEILKQLPTSHLLIKTRGLSDATTKEYLLERFARQSIGPERLDLRGRTPQYSSHLEQYNQIDIALDTFPYHGTTTTCEALWMGVPVITLAGNTHVQRVGVSLLTNIRATDWVAQTPKDYVQKALDLANNPQKLEEIRASLRKKISSSRLLDARRVSQDIEQAYRQMWDKWCAESNAGVNQS